jgi:hypothetical protein
MIPTVYDWDEGLYCMADMPIPVCLPDKY